MRERRAVPPRLGAAVAAMMIVLGATGFLPGSSPPANAASSLVLDGHRRLAIGVDHYRYVTATPRNVVHVLKVKAGSNVTVDAVLSNNRVIGDSTSTGLEPTSSMCRRAAALACVNGDFASCYSCTAPLGGVIRYSEVMRSPNPSWPQVWIGPDGIDAGTLAVTGRAVATYKWKEPLAEGLPATEDRTKTLRLDIHGVNVPRPPNGLVLYTPRYAASTKTASGGTEVRITVDRMATLNRTVHLKVGAMGTSGNASIPSGTFVLSASGDAEAQLLAFWQEARRYPDRLTAAGLKLVSSVPGITQSLGGHPVILDGGKPLPPPAPDDTASRVRHPRTVMGWNSAGDVWLVTIDGRQPDWSTGATFWEAAAMLLQLGATDGINLDGGGSTTFVAAECTNRSLCVRNRPSDGRERAVTTAFAVVPRR